MTRKHVSPRPRWRMPAEWERHEATWLAWPHNAADWPGKMALIHWAYGEIVRKLTPGETVRIIVNDASHEAKARRILQRVGADLDAVEFFRFPTNRSWTRDFGPIFVESLRSKSRGARQAIARFHFTGWAKYPNWRKDDRIPDRVARKLGIQMIPIQHKGRGVVMEGGAIDVNGAGTLLATEECLLHKRRQVRNPGFDQKDYDTVFRDYLGAEQVIWLGRGIAGDDTHGHVDDFCRFVNAHTVVLCREDSRADANHAALSENRERLQHVRLANGRKLDVIELPMPAPLYLDRERLPASYANFYMANTGVLVPTFNDPNDHVALGILSDLITDRPVIGIHAVDLVWGLGTLHCLTQQQPALV